jgi:4-hydroxy-tetrahydrodipicolinate synthase
MPAAPPGDDRAPDGTRRPPPFGGLGVALVTLFGERGELDVRATAALAARLVDQGVRAVVVAGSTGEAATLDPAERLALLDEVRAAVAVPVLAGAGAPSARQAVALTRAAVEHGADGVLVLSPPVADPLPYYQAVAEAAGAVPVLAYHLPAVSAPGIALERLAALPVAALKDSSGDPQRLLQELAVRPALPVYTGSAVLLAMAGGLGAQGAILALANAEPELCAQALAGDHGAQLALLPAHLEAEADFPAGLKRRLAARLGTSPVVRLG